MDRPLRILHLEDLASDAEMVDRVLRKAKFEFEKKVVIGRSEFIRALHEFQPDIILSDHSLPAFNSLEALRITKEAGIGAPLILVTATVSEEYAVNVMQEGASDYILKDRLERLPNAIQNALDKFHMEKERLLADEARRRLITQTSIQVQEREREEIGKELHDNINQILAATRLHLDLAIHESSEEAVTAVLMKSYKNLSFAMEEIRQLSQSLVAPSLGGVSLDKALARLIEDMPSASSLRLHLDTTGYRGDVEDEELKLTCYRIVQVQLSNIIKHARAKSATIRLRKTNCLELIIADDGIGFQPGAKTNGIGLRNIRNRVSYYNGGVTIDSQPGKGCILTIIIPLVPAGGMK